MAIKTKRPPMKETVGAQYICFAKETEEGEFDGTYETDVEKTEVVKTVKVTVNADTGDSYASGKVYDSDTPTKSIDIETEVIAFPEDTLAKMKGDSVDAGGLILSGSNSQRPFLAYGKVVKLRHGGYRYEWYPKCKLTENSDDISTSEDKTSEQTDTIKIKAYPFDDAGNIVAKITESSAPEGMTEDKFFAKPILTKEDLAAALT
ncbi:major tail protein [Eubacterium ramulus]|uniref:major tail protein n=1 Tax=Eubacterium ramulus TaxID=39490 RepID=UPI0035A34067